MKQYILISDRWSRESSVQCTFADLQEQAKVYGGPVTVEEVIRHGQDVVIDNTGEVIAEEIN